MVIITFLKIDKNTHGQLQLLTSLFGPVHEISVLIESVSSEGAGIRPDSPEPLLLPYKT